MRSLVNAILTMMVVHQSALGEIKLRQSTANQSVPMGAFVDPVDGHTARTALTISSTDIRIWKFNATSLANKNSGGAMHMSNGVYFATLDATDTNAIGPLVIFVNVADALPVRVECEVLPAALYDAWQAGTLPANVTQFGSSAGAFSGGRPEVNATHWGGTAVASANVRADVRQVDGVALGTHGAGYLPADVRQFGGANGIFPGGRPEVTTSSASNEAIALADQQVLLVAEISSVSDTESLNLALDSSEWDGEIEAGQTVLVRKGDAVLTRRLTGFAPEQPIEGLSQIGVAPDMPFDATGGTVTILAAPAQLETIRTDVSAVKSKSDNLPSVAAGAAGGLFIAGSNAGTTVNFTGSLSGSVGSVTSQVTTSAASNQAIAAADRAVLFTGTVDDAANSTTEVFVDGGATALPAEVSGQMLVITHSGKLYVREIVGFTGGGDALQVATLPFTSSTGDALAILAIPQ